jgi:hypothetical protein
MYLLVPTVLMCAVMLLVGYKKYNRSNMKKSLGKSYKIHNISHEPLKSILKKTPSSNNTSNDTLKFDGNTVSVPIGEYPRRVSFPEISAMNDTDDTEVQQPNRDSIESKSITSIPGPSSRLQVDNNISIPEPSHQNQEDLVLHLTLPGTPESEVGSIAPQLELWFDDIAPIFGSNTNGKDAVSDVGSNAPAYTAFVTNEYEARHPDELTLKEGDQILITKVYEDGWGVGRNISTNEKGVFPVVCVSAI